MKMIEEARSNWEETVSGTNRQDEEQPNQRPRGGDQQNNKMKLINVKNTYVHRESMSEGFQKD